MDNMFDAVLHAYMQLGGLDPKLMCSEYYPCLAIEARERTAGC